jgi:hypothetical protein
MVADRATRALPRSLLLRSGFFFGLMAIGAVAVAQEVPSFPQVFVVYVSPDHVIINHPEPGFQAYPEPVRIDYAGDDGCYIAVYTRDSEQSGYPVSDTIFVVGFIRVRGLYDQSGICRPTGYETQDISKAPAMTKMTNAYFPGRVGGTWAGGDTGGFFGPDALPQ